MTGFRCLFCSFQFKILLVIGIAKLACGLVDWPTISKEGIYVKIMLDLDNHQTPYKQFIRDKKVTVKNPTLQPQDEQGWLEDEE